MKTAAKRMKQRSAGKPDIELGKRIRLRRVEMKISQAELGEKLGVSFQQVQKYEKGVNRVGAARLQQIATALDVPVTFFYDGDNKAREVESLLFLDSAFSLRLLRAYSKIKDPDGAASARLADGIDRSERGLSRSGSDLDG
ncbi:transcriptional regulator with XRE-family HTH domain [Bradyrhizobium japonicum]